MKKFGFLTVLFVLIIQTGNAAELSIRGGNLLRWARGDGYLQGSGIKTQEFWFENITDLAATYNNFEFGLSNSIFQPSEFGEVQGRISAIDFKYLEYRRSFLTLTAGNYYATVGRGLALNLYEDYALNFDSNLEGARAVVNTDYLNLLAFQGRSYPSISPEGSRVREGDLMGSLVQFKPHPIGSLGGYYLYVPDSAATSSSYPETRMPGGFLDFSKGPIGLYAESVLQYVQDGSADPYYGNYFAVDYTGYGFGIVFDYKDYNFKKFGSFTTGGTTTAEILAYQNPPIVQREFTTTLLSKHPHLPVFNDEVGFQVEGTYQPIDPLTLTLNFSRSSAHRRESLIPSLHEEDAPFWELFFEGEYVHPTGDWLRLDAGVNEEVKVTGPKDERVSYFWQKKQAVAVEGTHYLDSRNSIALHVETMHVDDVKEEEVFWEYFATIGFSRSPWGGLTLIFETTGDPDAGVRDHWIGSELTLNFLQQHNLLLFVGQDRGGLKCTSGRCRYVDPFSGVKLTLQSTF